MPTPVAAEGVLFPKQPPIAANIHKHPSALKQTIAAIEAACLRNNKHKASSRIYVETGIADIDEALGGGFTRGTIHEFLPKTAQDLTAASGFTFGLAARAQEAHAHTLYIQHDFTMAEFGRPYLPGLKLSGIEPSSLIYLHVPRAEDVLWAMNEALKCRGFSCVIAEFPPQTRSLDLTTTRRLSLAAQEGWGLGIILRHTATVEPNAATTRWLVTAATSHSGEDGGISVPSFHMDLVKNRFGPSGQWQVEWHAHERKFKRPPLPLSVARPPSHRSHRTEAVAQPA